MNGVNVSFHCGVVSEDFAFVTACLVFVLFYTGDVLSSIFPRNKYPTSCYSLPYKHTLMPFRTSLPLLLPRSVAERLSLAKDFSSQDDHVREHDVECYGKG